jgi:hypothetical protein
VLCDNGEAPDGRRCFRNKQEVWRNAKCASRSLVILACMYGVRGWLWITGCDSGSQEQMAGCARLTALRALCRTGEFIGLRVARCALHVDVLTC